jgi:hypothetical protein
MSRRNDGADAVLSRPLQYRAHFTRAAELRQLLVGQTRNVRVVDAGIVSGGLPLGDPGQDGLLAAFAGFAGGADAGGAAGVAGAGGQQFGGLAEQARRQAIERRALADAAGVGVVEIEIGFERSGRRSDLFAQA